MLSGRGEHREPRAVAAWSSTPSQIAAPSSACSHCMTWSARNSI